MAKGLSGWQRLWVVVTILYLLPVAFFTATDFWPKEQAYADTRLHKSIDAVGEYMESSTPGYSYEGSYTVRDKYYKDLSDEQIIERLHTKFKDKVDLSDIDAEYLHKVTNLPTERVHVLGYALLWWLGPAIGLYALGAAVGWVFRGFRGERA